MDYQYRIFEPKNRQINITMRNALLYSLKKKALAFL